MNILIALTLLISLTSAANREPPQGVSEFIRQNRINLIPENMPAELVWEFKREFDKFPRPLLEEMRSRGARITLIYGRGVTVDPSFRFRMTPDGRSWDDVPGAGGSPALRQPTRIVVNRLHERGSVNLFLHEHAHAVNSLYRSQGLTNSNAWKDLIARNPEARDLLMQVCGQYCLSNDDEAFAELFAIYHGGGRRMMERAAPGMAEFFRNFHSVKEFTRGKRCRNLFRRCL